MKKILITGAHSYIGVSFENYIKNGFLGKYSVDTVDMLDGSWRKADFSGYDTVFHVAGIAHQRETDENRELYYSVNRDLAIETAKKAKDDGVRHFVFLSSMSVYGINRGVVTAVTEPAPRSHYGISKLQAEEGICALSDRSFAVCILRPPMVYGCGCKGNFNTVVKLARKLPMFPRIGNKRSMIYIDNLCEFVRQCADRCLGGVHYPQNCGYAETSFIAKTVAETLHKKLFLSRLLGTLVKLTMPFCCTVQKAFGSLTYENTDTVDFKYCVVELRESVERSVQRK